MRNAPLCNTIYVLGGSQEDGCSPAFSQDVRDSSRFTMRLLVLSSLLCILLLFFPVEGRRRHIRSQKMQLCCLVTRLNGTTLKAPRLSKASWENPALLVPPPRPRPKNSEIKTRDSVHFAASKNPVQRRASSGHYTKICRPCKIKSSVPYRWVVPGALPQV